MKRTLTIAALAIGLATFSVACDDDDTTPTTDAAAGHDGSTTGGADGSVSDSGGGTGGGGAAGSDGAAIDAASDAAASDAVSSDAGDDAVSSDATAIGDASIDGTVSAVDWNTCGAAGLKPGISAADFCARAMNTCGFAAGTQDKFADLATCMTRYTAYTPTQQACTAYHLCVAWTAPDTNKATHCPHPSGGSGNPCGVPLN